jgi:hypothetical protein
MTPPAITMWRVHILVLGAMGAPVVPAGLLDLWLAYANPAHGSDLSTLVLSGALGGYVPWLILESALTTLALVSGKFQSLASIHVIGSIVSLSLVIAVVAAFLRLAGVQ